MKPVIVKAVGFATALAVLMISTYGCAVMKTLYGDLQEAADAVVVEGTFGDDAEWVEVEHGYAGEHISTGTEIAFSSGAAYGELEFEKQYSGFQSDELDAYADYGVEFMPANGYYWFHGKPITAFRDEGYFTLTDSDMMSVGALVVVARDAAGNIIELKEVSAEEFGKVTGLIVTKHDLEKESKAANCKYRKEDAKVGEMNTRQYNEFVDELHAKYRHENAVVECADFVIFLEKDTLKHLSSFCSSSNNPYGVKVMADYDIADEIDLKELDSVDVDHILLDMLSANEYQNTKDVEQAAKQAVAELYGISDKNLIAFSNII